MTLDAAGFVGNIPENYEKGLVPHIFIDYARHLAERSVAGAPASVLELAAGTGVVTRELRSRLPESSQLTATDLNQPMLDVAKERFGKGESVKFEAVDALELPYDDASFDAVVCQFGVMFFPDKAKSYREVHRTLKPGGRYLFNVWDKIDLNPFARVAHETAAKFFTGDPPMFYQVPFGYHQTGEIEGALAEASFTGIRSEVVEVTKEIPDASLFARGLVYGNPLFQEITSRGTTSPDEVMAAITEELQAEFGANPGVMPLQAIFFSSEKA